MACNPHKDMASVLAKGRINVLATRHFFSVYLWRDIDALNDAYVVSDGVSDYGVVHEPGNCSAHVSRMPYGEWPLRPRWLPRWLYEILHRKTLCRVFGVGTRHPPKLGEIHFYAGGWDEEVVSHECAHAAITAANALGVSPVLAFRCDGSLSERFKTTQIYRESDGTAVASLSDEELFCYCLGDIFRQTYRWLWKNDGKKALDEKEISVE